MKPHIPIQHRSLNKFLKYEIRDFDDGYGNSGKVRIAIYLDKNGKQQEVTAQVLWEQMYGKKYER